MDFRVIRSDDKEVWAASSSRLVADASGRPLQAMAGYGLNERQRERLEIVRRSGETLLHVLNSVLDISKIEAGQLELQEIDFELGDLVRGWSRRSSPTLWTEASVWGCSWSP